jgi:septal ring factor EnvC (AmiA/AmiB activator)
MNHQRNYVFSPLQDVTASLLNTVNNSPSKSSREKRLVTSLLVQVNSSTDRCKELFDEVINETIGSIQRTLDTVVSELNVIKADNTKLNDSMSEINNRTKKLEDRMIVSLFGFTLFHLFFISM